MWAGLLKVCPNFSSNLILRMFKRPIKVTYIHLHTKNIYAVYAAAFLSQNLFELTDNVTTTPTTIVCMAFDSSVLRCW